MMTGINSLLFQPISIYKPYMLSLISDVFLKYNRGVMGDANETKQNYMAELAQQHQSSTSGGASKYPAIVSIKGPIIKYTSWNYIGTHFLSKVVKTLDKRPEISHIIFDIDSGGGMVSGTRGFCEDIRQCSTPTIAFTAGYACSAAQEIFSAADIGVVSPYADKLGSIGTLISYQDFSLMFEKWGAKIFEEYAPQSTEKNKSHREWVKGNPKEIKEELKGYTEEFIAVMKSYRGDKLKDDGKLFKGATYRPQEALSVGLADKMMTFDELIENL